MKRWIRLGAVAAVIAAMLVALVLLRSTDDAATDDAVREPITFAEDPERVQLLDNPRGEIARITVKRGDSELTIVRHDENLFRPEYEYDVAFNTQSVNRIVSGAAAITSRRVIGEVEEVSEYGFAEPAATITVELTSGEIQRITVGDQTPARDAYYVMRPDDPLVYSVFNTWITPFFTTLDSLRLRVIPQVAFERLERVVVQTIGGRTIRVEKLPQWDDDPELGFSAFAVTGPYDRRFQVNTNWLEELSTNMQALRIGRYVDDGPANLAQYGLAAPRARLLVADNAATLELLVGEPTEGGRYAKFPSAPSVFVLSGIEQIVTVRPYAAITAFSLIINIDLVDTVVVESPEATYVGRIERTVEGEEEPEETYFLDETQIDEKLFKNLYQWAIGLQFDAEIPPSERPSPAELAARERLATITYNLNDGRGPLSVSFAQHNANFAVVVRDGGTEFLISTAKIRRMLAAFAQAAAE